MEEWPSVSVVVPTRARSVLARRAVSAILAQRYEGELECVVVSDGAPPDGIAADPRVRLLDGGDANAAAARNAGARAAAGELLAFCDDDDVWLAEKLRVQVAALRASGALAATCGIVVHYRGRPVPRLPGDDVATLADLVRSRLAHMHTSTILVGRDDFLGRIGPFDEQIPGSFGEDYEWLLRAAARGPIRTVRQPLVDVHWHGSSYFQSRWDLSVAAHRYLLEHHPELERDRIGAARIYGQLAFACAAGGRPRDALRWARRCLRADWRQPRAYLALAVGSRILPPALLLDGLHRAGRGI
jgi:glycosyltransferase involved in cell wall biosynthesis